MEESEELTWHEGCALGRQVLPPCCRRKSWVAEEEKHFEGSTARRWVATPSLCHSKHPICKSEQWGFRHMLPINGHSLNIQKPAPRGVLMTWNPHTA